MEKIAEADFDSFSNISVVTIRDLYSKPETPFILSHEIGETLNSFLRDNHCDHLFIDEMIPLPIELTYPTCIQTICMTLKVERGNLAQIYFSINYFFPWKFSVNTYFPKIVNLQFDSILCL